MEQKDIYFNQAQPYIERENWTAALPLLRRAAELGHGNAMSQLGHAYCQGLGVEKDPGEGVAWLRKGMRRGSAVACYNLAVCTEHGVGTPRNWIMARDLYRKSGELGYAKGYIGLGRFYEKGKGVEQDLREALALYEKGTEPGKYSVDANRIRSRLEDPRVDTYYRAQDLREEDRYQEAFAFLLRSAELGNPIAQTEVGIAYLMGEGVCRDDARGAAWLERAAEAGEPDAQGRLGICYMEGIGVPRNHRRAFELLTEAAEIGTKIGTFYLAHYYEQGICTPRDLNRALELYREAAAMKMPGAAEKVRLLERM